MIFVSVGTHEAPFDRLIREIDSLVTNKLITEKVIAQIGYGQYIPEAIEWKRFYPYEETQKLAKNARILITHGGPSSFIMALQNDRIPIVVPRKKEFGEHVNDHQSIFCKEVERRNKNIIVVEHISDLAATIIGYDTLVESRKIAMPNNNKKFCEEFEKIALNLVGDKNEI